MVVLKFIRSGTNQARQQCKAMTHAQDNKTPGLHEFSPSLGAITDLS